MDTSVFSSALKLNPYNIQHLQKRRNQFTDELSYWRFGEDRVLSMPMENAPDRWSAFHFQLCRVPDATLKHNYDIDCYLFAQVQYGMMTFRHFQQPFEHPINMSQSTLEQVALSVKTEMQKFYLQCIDSQLPFGFAPFLAYHRKVGDEPSVAFTGYDVFEDRICTHAIGIWHTEQKHTQTTPSNICQHCDSLAFFPGTAVCANCLKINSEAI